MGRYFGGPLISGYPYGTWRFPRKGLFYGTTFGVSIASLAWERGALWRQALFLRLTVGISSALHVVYCGGKALQWVRHRHVSTFFMYVNSPILHSP